MKAFISIFLLLSLAACGSRTVDNPAANAATHTEQEFEKDVGLVQDSPNAKLAGVEVYPDYSEAGVTGSEVKLKAKLTKKIRSGEEAAKIRESIQIEIARIDAFQEKYGKVFRLRFKDGDLQVKELTPEFVTKLKNLRQAWVQALEDLNSLYPQ